jgi:hypothetical protein
MSHHIEFTTLGRHLARVEDDILFIRWNGEVSLEEIQEMYEVALRIRARFPVVLGLNDGRLGTGLSVEARRFAVENRTSASRIDAVATFGASFPKRVFGTMILRAATSLIGCRTRMEFFNSEAEARGWLIAQRENILAEREARAPRSQPVPRLTLDARGP